MSSHREEEVALPTSRLVQLAPVWFLGRQPLEHKHTLTCNTHTLSTAPNPRGPRKTDVSLEGSRTGVTFPWESISTHPRERTTTDMFPCKSCLVNQLLWLLIYTVTITDRHKGSFSATPPKTPSSLESFAGISLQRGGGFLKL